MENQQHQPESEAEISPANTLSLTAVNHHNQPEPSSVDISKDKWQRIGRQTFEFLENLPNYISNFLHKYKSATYSIILILLAVITVKLLLTILDAVDDIPILASTFELIGLGYAIWFIFRYLLKTETRQELVNLIESWKIEVLGEEVLN